MSATPQDMLEYCEACNCELELGQIGLCEDCRSLSEEDGEPSLSATPVSP